MFTDQKKYLLLYQVTSDLICLAVQYYIFMPFIFKAVVWLQVSIFGRSDAENFICKTGCYIKLSPVFILTPVVIFLIFKGYQKICVQKSCAAVYGQAFFLSLIATGCLFLILLNFDFTLKYNMFFSVVSLSLLWLLLWLSRVHAVNLIGESASHPHLIKYLLIVGTGSAAREISQYITSHPETGLRVTGFLTHGLSEVGEKKSGITVLGTVEELPDIIHDHYTDCVLYVVDDQNSQYSRFLTITCAVRGIDLGVTNALDDFWELNVKNIFTEKINNVTIKVLKPVYRNPYYFFSKRVLDVIFSIVLIGLCMPLWIVLPVAIKLTSAGPVLFRQERVGKHGKKFMLYKFRSMFHGADKLQERLIHLNEMDGPAFKIRNDPRQTVTGKFLRKTSLDELPQLFNVFKGDISFVGPRPAIENEVIQYRPWEMKRLSVVQGITCIWQISGRNDIRFDEWMKLDLLYIDNRSLSLDFRILYKTIPAVLLKKGAY